MLKDYLPFTLAELAAHGPMNSGDLSEAVWGTSGRGNSRLTQNLFPHMAWKGLVKTWKQGRAVMYQITAKGVDELLDYEKAYGKIKTYAEQMVECDANYAALQQSAVPA